MKHLWRVMLGFIVTMLVAGWIDLMRSSGKPVKVAAAILMMVMGFYLMGWLAEKIAED